MQAYAKSAMPFLGVTTPIRRKVCREVFAGLDLKTAAAWRRTVLALWRDARYREERYAAIDLTEARRFDRFQDMAAIKLREVAYPALFAATAWVQHNILAKT